MNPNPPNPIPPEVPIVSLRKLFRWSIVGLIFWVLLSVVIVPMGMNYWVGFAKYGRIIDEQGQPVPGVVIVSAFRSSTGGGHQASFGCTDRFVTETNAAGEYETPSGFAAVTGLSDWSWGFAPYKRGWLREGEDKPYPPGQYSTKTVVYAWERAAPPRPWKLEWANGGLRQHIPDLVMKPSTLPPDERIEYLFMLKQSMQCELRKPLALGIEIFQEAYSELCNHADTVRFTRLQLANYNGLWAEQPGVVDVHTAKLFDEAPNPWEPERVKRVCELLKPVGEKQ